MEKFEITIINKENKEEKINVDKWMASPLTKAKDNNLSFMDSFLDKANKAINEIVEKHNDVNTYVDKENKPKAIDTVNQAIKRDSEKVNMLTVLCKLFNKSTLDNDNIKSILDYATYNNKSKIVYNISVGMSYDDIINKYPKISFKTIKEVLDNNNLTIDFASGKVINK